MLYLVLVRGSAWRPFLVKAACPLQNERGGKNKIKWREWKLISNFDIPVHLRGSEREGKSRSALGFRFRRDSLVFLSGPYYYTYLVYVRGER